MDKSEKKIFMALDDAMKAVQDIIPENRAVGDCRLTLQYGEPGMMVDGGHYEYALWLTEVEPGIFRVTEYCSCEAVKDEDVGYVVLNFCEQARLLATPPDDGAESGYWKPEYQAWLEKALA